MNPRIDHACMAVAFLGFVALLCILLGATKPQSFPAASDAPASAQLAPAEEARGGMGDER